MRPAVPFIGQIRLFNIMVDSQAFDSEFGSATRLKNSFSTAEV